MIERAESDQVLDVLLVAVDLPRVVHTRAGGMVADLRRPDVLVRGDWRWLDLDLRVGLRRVLRPRLARESPASLVVCRDVREVLGPVPVPRQVAAVASVR